MLSLQSLTVSLNGDLLRLDLSQSLSKTHAVVRVFVHLPLECFGLFLGSQVFSGSLLFQDVQLSAVMLSELLHLTHLLVN